MITNVIINNNRHKRNKNFFFPENENENKTTLIKSYIQNKPFKSVKSVKTKYSSSFSSTFLNESATVKSLNSKYLRLRQGMRSIKDQRKDYVDNFYSTCLSERHENAKKDQRKTSKIDLNSNKIKEKFEKILINSYYPMINRSSFRGICKIEHERKEVFRLNYIKSIFSYKKSEEIMKIHDKYMGFIRISSEVERIKGLITEYFSVFDRITTCILSLKQKERERLNEKERLDVAIKSKIQKQKNYLQKLKQKQNMINEYKEFILYIKLNTGNKNNNSLLKSLSLDTKKGKVKIINKNKENTNTSNISNISNISKIDNPSKEIRKQSKITSNPTKSLSPNEIYNEMKNIQDKIRILLQKRTENSSQIFNLTTANKKLFLIQKEKKQNSKSQFESKIQMNDLCLKANSKKKHEINKEFELNLELKDENIDEKYGKIRNSNEFVRYFVSKYKFYNENLSVIRKFVFKGVEKRIIKYSPELTLLSKKEFIYNISQIMNIIISVNKDFTSILLNISYEKQGKIVEKLKNYLIFPKFDLNLFEFSEDLLNSFLFLNDFLNFNNQTLYIRSMKKKINENKKIDSFLSKLFIFDNNLRQINRIRGS